MTSIQINWGGGFYRSQGWPKLRPEGPNTEARRPIAGVGFLRRGQRAPHHQLEHCKLPPAPPAGHLKFGATWDLKTKLLQKCLIMCQGLQKGSNFEGEKRSSRPGIFIGGDDRLTWPPRPRIDATGVFKHLGALFPHTVMAGSLFWSHKSNHHHKQLVELP